MTTHTALTDLPALLTAAGVNVVVTDGYHTAQGDYLWTDPDTMTGSFDNPPSGFMPHHTAGSAATPPPADDSKANAWAGLWRDGRLYQEGGGIPTVVLSCAGPARISSGYGYKPAAWDYTFQDLRAPVDAGGPDGSTALNRFVFNLEVVHRGDGSPLALGVFDVIVKLGVVLHDMFGWSERTLGHRSWTSRKIDPYWSTGTPNDGARCIVDVQDAIAGFDMDYRTVKNVPDAPWARDVIDWGIDVGKVINVKDDQPDDWENLNMTDGRLWTFLMRLDDSIMKRLLP